MAAEIIKYASDKILELFKLNSEINKDRFLKIYEPMFENLTVVHNFYRKSFNKAINLLPDHFESKEAFERKFHENNLSSKEFENHLKWVVIKKIDDSGKIIEYGIKEINSEEYFNSIKRVHEIFENERIDNLIMRTQLREFATACLQKIEKKIEFKFIWAVANYFINYKRSYIDNINDNQYGNADKIMDFVKSNKEDFNINRITDSPSFYISQELLKSNYAPFIKNEIKNVLFELQQFYEEACLRYMELKFERFT